MGGTEAHLRFMEVAAMEPGDAPQSGPVTSLIRRALELIRTEFEDRTWQAFWLMTVGQNSSTEVAQKMKMTPGAVRQAKYKVLRRLRQELGDSE